MTTAGGNGVISGSPLGVLRRIATRPPPDPTVEKCDMCAEIVGDEHPHVVDIESRALMCTCRGCYLLFTAEQAHLRYRAVPDRYLSFPDFEVAPGVWDSLEIPVGLVFLFSSSVLSSMVAFYPGPAGVTESELDLAAWEGIVATNPAFATLQPDVEALLVHTGEHGEDFRCFLVPIDACYELAGRLRMVWRGFDGGQDAHEQIESFFAQVTERSRPAPGTRDRSA